jgi:gamma-glutamylaminecyclotransferase
MTLVLVYGTLMRGEPAHGLLADARFVRLARTDPVFTLVSLGPYPAMLPGGRVCVRGELYKVDEGMLGRLDRYEGVPRLYRRDEVALRGGARAQAYILARRRSERDHVIASGDWRNHAD